jgi:uracil-DNA glycosylase
MNPKRRYFDMPKVFKDRVAIEDRRAHIYDENVRVLNQYVEALKEAKGADFDVPFFDPADGGVNARILLVLETPGRRAAGRQDASELVSIDNDDDTAANMSAFEQKANLTRDWLVHWNIIPWYVQTGKPILKAQREEGAEELEKVITLMPRLQVIVLLGNTADIAYSRHFKDRPLPKIEVLKSYHPSPQCINRVSDRRDEVISTLTKARKLACK